MAEISEFDLDDEQREAKRRTDADRRRAELRLAFVHTMESPDGALVLRTILEKTHIYRSTYVKGDANDMAWREGVRNVGLWLLAQMSDADADLAFSVLRTTKKE